MLGLISIEEWQKVACALVFRELLFRSKRYTKIHPQYISCKIKYIKFHTPYLEIRSTLSSFLFSSDFNISCTRTLNTFWTSHDAQSCSKRTLDYSAVSLSPLKITTKRHVATFLSHLVLLLVPSQLFQPNPTVQTVILAHKHTNTLGWCVEKLLTRKTMICDIHKCTITLLPSNHPFAHTFHIVSYIYASENFHEIHNNIITEHDNFVYDFVCLAW
jgi:hypothetical protein